MPATLASAVSAPPWGTYAPTGYRRFLRALVSLGFAHGSLKRWFLRQWTAAGPREPADITSCGLKFRVFPWDNTIEGKLLLASRMRDGEELGLIGNHLPPGGVFLDVGANIGFYSLVAASRGARVLAFEPLTTAFERMQFNIHANGLQDRITALQVALGAERGMTSFHEVVGDLGGSSAVKSDLPGRKVDVPLLPLADALEENDIASVAAMKIDVEGFEDAVLCPFFAAAPRARWPRFVVMEHCHRGNWKQDLLGVMRRAGYEQTGENRSNVFLRLPPPP